MFELPLEPVWTVILAGMGCVYLVGLEVVKRGLKQLRSQDGSEETADGMPRVSVIIPCRDEARHIGSALKDLATQDYPGEHFEVIVVDDRSTDGTGDAARKYSGQIPGLKVIEVTTCPEGISPKKNAILQGLREADGQIIVTTDGDCRFRPGWIGALVGNFASDTGAVTGLTVFDREQREPLWQRMQQVDYLSHSFFAAGAIAQGLAFNCNGSNLALRQEVFEKTGGYTEIGHVITGDDTLLVQRILSHGKWRIRFCTDPDSVVRSWPEETPVQVFNQRLRWGSGGLSYSPIALAFALATFVFFLGLFLSPFLWLGGQVGWLWVLFFGAKATQEIWVMERGWGLFGLKGDRAALLAMELIHIPAILTFSIGGHLWGFRWKGQRFKRTRIPVFNKQRMTHL